MVEIKWLACRRLVELKLTGSHESKEDEIPFDYMQFSTYKVEYLLYYILLGNGSEFEMKISKVLTSTS